ncbi:glycosyltransferase family 2 protein [Rhodospirillum rubrum]|uniref:Glycosyl transferase, family 2 n=1 Tax=Rhodospirillum rubrum (strain ATCC 11170 / ATH 1.1.1 / DSM 467 / LMG 4362 / NCIMB 8255 / S1) TaxID=269796 RepID=Q2RSH1_RHORT|nr:glycosyltransferase family 2 protein [Rhodospirillum rubrum]ABC22924.1 Glycosyl transferase, family 2 [Rhodospirillum rubrum ATCC 11170]AEO48647.1 glycosyl transferase family protein [Rhodospirillum rubrum F11]MBK5954541.1 glycosyl transferase [Rhodospirillum rubrum]QXG78910.1 glycosyltransferase family 2 protein [Rhodospirillum rubrum]HAQ00632.1 glycosyltransferase family 2 protein [Rhodospirillum rubrum]
MKLIVQIPCYNEEQTLPQTVADIPRHIPGIDQVEILIIDDGSTDRTVEVARGLGVDHIICNRNNRGLARSFRSGLDASLALGADIVVNTDGDNQYCGLDIPKLIQPIVDGRADIVVGDRRTDQQAHFSWGKKQLQRLGSAVVRGLSELDIPDAVSGFRAISRDAALAINIISPFSYTVEMLIQAGKKHMAVVSVPVRTNPKTRDSRLFRSIPKFIERSVTTMIRMYLMYQPLRVFLVLGLILSTIGIIPILRWFLFYLDGAGAGNLHSLILGATFLIIGFLTFTIALVADLINFNRHLIEMSLERVRRLELSNGSGLYRPKDPPAPPPATLPLRRRRSAE